MTDVITVFEGLVTKVERSTNGYGDSERTVGIDATIQSRWEETDMADGSTSMYTRTSTIHLPKGYLQPQVGDKVSVILSKGMRDPIIGPSEVPFNDSGVEDLDPVSDDGLPPEDGIEGDPYHDEIKQGGG